MQEEYQDRADGWLVGRFRQGDSAAFEEVFRRYRKRIYAYARARTGDNHLAEDITEDCFLRLARNAGKIDPGKSLAGWLFRVARNRTVDILRKRKFEVELDRETVACAGGRTADPPFAGLIEEERKASVREALSALPDRDREVMALRFFGDLTFREIARVVRSPLGTVLWRARRALESMRKSMPE